MTDQKLKTLREIASEVGFPFEAERQDGEFIRCLDISPIKRVAIGWNRHDRIVSYSQSDEGWTLVTPKKKLVEFLYQDGESYYSGWDSTEELAREWCGKLTRKFIKVIREIEI